MIPSHANNISQRLFLLMLVIILSLMLISAPLINLSYQEYAKSRQALVELHILQALSKTATMISRERAPTNRVLASTPENLKQYQRELHRYRQGLDQQFKRTIILLQTAGYSQFASTLEHKAALRLRAARDAVDHYSALPPTYKTPQQMDQVVLGMFTAWDSYFVTMNQFATQSQAMNSQIQVSNSFTLLLILADLRDQAGRMASSIMAPVTFGQKMPIKNRERALMAQQRTLYSFNLLKTLQPQQQQTTEFSRLHQQLKIKFLDHVVPMMNQLLEQGQQGTPYALTDLQLIQSMVNTFSPVVELQTYILERSTEMAIQKQRRAEILFLLTLIVSLISLTAAIFTMVYAQRRVFKPLLQAKEVIFALSDPHADTAAITREIQQNDFFSLSEAIHKLQNMLQQRDGMESRLKRIANSDALTGVGNRLALEHYIAILETSPHRLLHTSLIVIDIDDFKQINDCFGHLVGDEVIIQVAEQLKRQVRSTDFIVRYGGDEFLILIEQMNLQNTLRLAESIRKNIANLCIQAPNTQKNIQLSISIGVTSGAKSWLELMDKADQSLLKAKSMGKNSVQH